MERLINENFTITKVVIAYKNSLSHGKIRTLNTPKRHSHCFAFVLSGECEYMTDEHRFFSVRGGDVLYLAQNQLYTMDVKTDDYKVIVIDFFLDTTDKLKSDCIKTDNPEVKSAFEKIITLYNSESPVKNAKLCSLANMIYAMLCEEKEYSSSFDRQKVNTACEYIRANFTNPELSCKEIAKACNVSEVHLRRLFRKTIGISPITYITNLRFDKAQRLLIHSELTVTQIALQCGFSDVYYFSKAYKNHYGHAPTKQ